jgi:long-subunit acyl-CoA synthetase (AMP-forming)
VKPPSFVQQIRSVPEGFSGSVQAEPGGPPRAGAEFLDDVRELAAGLIGYGFGPGERAAVVGSFNADALAGVFAIWTAGGTVVPVEDAVPAPVVRDALRATRVRIALAVDRSDLERLLRVRPELPDLEIVFVASPEGGGRPSPARTFEDVAASGRARLRAAPGLLTDLPACPPVMVLAASAEGLGTRRRGPEDLDRGAEDLAARFGIGPQDRVLVSLPLGGAGEFDVARAVLARGAELLFAGGAPDLGEVCRRAAPTRAFVREADLSLLERAVEREIAGRGFLGRTLLRRAFRTVEDRTRHPHRASLADRWVLRDLGSRLTGGSLRMAACPGNPPSTPRLAALGVSTRPLEGGA